MSAGVAAVLAHDSEEAAAIVEKFLADYADANPPYLAASRLTISATGPPPSGP